MSMKAFIRRYINQLSERQVFKNTDLNSLGSRGSIDMALSDLEKRERIVRLTRGLYMKGDAVTPRPSIVEVARLKAQAFGHQLIEDVDDPTFAGVQTPGKNEVTFYFTGKTTSFMYGDTKVILKSISPKKLSNLRKRRELERTVIIPRGNAELLKQFRDFLSQPGRVR
ncbi:MAG: hypothetical protein C0507_18710 [Cyanobacteria bacterium PR.3.49]|nr:hypothetical protein [Cyanobacteria bacterium PR.3.49]